MSGKPLILKPAFLVCVGLLAVTAVGMAVLPGVMNVYLRKLPVESRRHMREVTNKTASWEQVGPDREEQEEILKTLGTHNTITRLYKERNPPAGQDPLLIELHLAYYTGMVDTVPHVSTRCMVAGGWVPVTRSKIIDVALDDSKWKRSTNIAPELPFAKTATECRIAGSMFTSVVLPFDLIAPSKDDDKQNNKVPMEFNDFSDPKTGITSLIGHFFIANHRLTSSAQEVRQLAFKLEDDYAYYVKVQVSTGYFPSREGKGRQIRNTQELSEASSGFVSEFLPEIMQCLPDWVKLETDRLNEKKKGSGKG